MPYAKDMTYTWNTFMRIALFLLLDSCAHKTNAASFHADLISENKCTEILIDSFSNYHSTINRNYLLII